MCLVGQEARAQSQEHDRRLSDFLQKFEDIDALRGQHAATVSHLRVPAFASGPGGGFPPTQLVAALRECAH